MLAFISLEINFIDHTFQSWVLQFIRVFFRTLIPSSPFLSLSLSRLSLHDNYKWFRPLKATRFGVEKQYIMYNQYVINYCSPHKSSFLFLLFLTFFSFDDLRGTTECLKMRGERANSSHFLFNGCKSNIYSLFLNKDRY